MSDNKHFSLGGFPPIYESVSYIKKKEYVPNNILSIQSILSKRGVDKTKNDEDDWGEKNNDTDNYDAKEIVHNMSRIFKGKNLKKKKASKKN